MTDYIGIEWILRPNFDIVKRDKALELDRQTAERLLNHKHCVGGNEDWFIIE